MSTYTDNILNEHNSFLYNPDTKTLNSNFIFADQCSALQRTTTNCTSPKIYKNTCENNFNSK